jgi:leucyl-tRNA synthetase
MRGRAVFQPIGFDAFGIHTENFALRSGAHPSSLTARTTANFARQLSSIGCAWDWEHVLDTSSPSYYRWTQWLLTRLFRAGLMYRADGPVLWCPSCLTVLAREQTESEGTRCERCESKVIERQMLQWWLRITRYADRLLAGLDELDWPERAKRQQRQWIGEAGDRRLHDWLISRQRYWGPPIPVIHCPDCGAVPVPEEDLPVLLPEVEEFRPRGTGRSPLAAVRSWVEVSCPVCGSAAERETDVSDTFVDSSWYFLRYPSTKFEDRPWDAERTAKVLPVDFYAGGPEHVQRHHLYARFVTMALFDLGLVNFEEPFPRVRLGGFIVHRGAKMSKSRGNVVTPDEFLQARGADVLRCALLFSAPWEDGGEFQLESIAGIERFFAKLWRLFARGHHDVSTGPGSAVSAGLHRLVRDVEEAIEMLRFNVGLARLMAYVPHLSGNAEASAFLRLLAPFAPHLAEELWSACGGPFSVHTAEWPVHDPAVIASLEVEWVVQVNGKVRGHFRLPAGASEAEAVASAMSSHRLAEALAGRPARRVMFVPGRLVNFVTEGRKQRRSATGASAPPRADRPPA